MDHVKKNVTTESIMSATRDWRNRLSTNAHMFTALALAGDGPD